MLYRMKEELTKQKSINSALQTDLDTLRGATGAREGSRALDAHGTITRLSDDHGAGEAHRHKLRMEIENPDLHRRLEDLHANAEELRDSLEASQRTASARLQHAGDLQVRLTALLTLYASLKARTMVQQ